MGRKPLRQIAFLTVCILAVAVWIGIRSRPAENVSRAELTDRVQQRLLVGDFESATELARKILKDAPDDPEALLMMGEVLTKSGELTDAAEQYERVLDIAPDDESRKIAAQCLGEIHLSQGHAESAERHFRSVLRIDPMFAEAHNRLAFKLGLEGRRWESMPHLFELVKLDRFSALHLLLLANPDQNLRVDRYQQQVAASGENYPLPRMAEAKELLRKGDFVTAREIIVDCLTYDSSQIEAKMLQGQLLQLTGRWDDFSEWSSSLTLQQESHPECWRLRGEWCLNQSDEKSAIRCFAETFYRDPNHLVACSQLVRLLTRQEDDPEVIDYFKFRVKVLEELVALTDSLHYDTTNVNAIHKAFQCCDYLERYWEAWGWCRVALEADPQLKWARQSKEDLEKHLVSDLPRTVIFRNMSTWNYSKYPLPMWPETAGYLAASTTADSTRRIRFEDHAASAGLDFTPELGPMSTDPKIGRRMYQLTGTGVAAIDYDLDGFPDLYFAQGARGIEPPYDSAITDRLFRNRWGESFVDVTESAGLRNEYYAQGANVGDVNNDGFPDIYVANLGQNRLFVNNGDGTFSERTDALPSGTPHWTSSVAIADLDGDGIPDLYDVNYLEPGAYNRYCNIDGYQRACNPRIFAGVRDRILRGDGRGGFEDSSAALPDNADEGRGLGIIVADFFEQGRNQIFIANDTVANNLYRFESPRGAETWDIQDDALLKGVAFDTRGRAQACMGVTFDDFNRDGRQDLFITNFYGDYNTLYLQQKETFADLTHSSNIAAYSYQLLGFGTQALDADLNGWPDLFVANGHIDDFSHKGVPFEMRPQLMRNLGDARFDDLDPATLGAYFQRLLVGRGAAKLDWNRDGLEDLAVTHLDAPPALLTNRSETLLRPLTISLVGTTLSRDAVGTRIVLQQGNRISESQVQLGSGYYSANERQIVLTVAPAEDISLQIFWPGRAEPVDVIGLQPEKSYRIVEDAQTAMLLP